MSVLLFAACATATPAWSAQERGGSADTTAIEDVKAVDSAVWAAATACDKDRFSELVGDDVALITPYGFVLDKARVRDSTAGACVFDWKMEPIKVQIYGDLAVVVGNHTYTSKPNRTPAVAGRYIYTRIYKKRNSRWLWVYGQHQIITDTSNHGDFAKDPLTEKDRAILKGWR
jgi:ketosteroid isomerase-like protein